MDTFQPGSTVLKENPNKFYWLVYRTRTDSYINICIDSHPFKYIHDVNLTKSNHAWGVISLVNWKEITKEEFLLWLELNPELAKVTSLDEIHQMD